MIRCFNLTLYRNNTPVLKDLNITLKKGSLTALIGPNGVGKTTFLQALMDAEHIKRQGILERRATLQETAYLPQLSEARRDFPLRVWDVVCLGLWPRLGLFAPLGSTLKETVAEALRLVGLEDKISVPIQNLSGGQFQRMLFARLVTQNRDFIILDEPFAAVDEETQNLLMRQIHRWHCEGKTIIVVLHSITLVRKHFPQTLLFGRDAFYCGPTNDVLTGERLAKFCCVNEWENPSSSPES
jgi:zinc/manganese transport system ATP-binding protein